MNNQLLHIRISSGLSPAQMVSTRVPVRVDLWAMRIPSMPHTHKDEHDCACKLLAYALREFLHPSSATDTVQPFTLPDSIPLPRIERDKKGKPYFPGYPGIQFNISHTHGAVLVGISSGGAIGVDIDCNRFNSCPRAGDDHITKRTGIDFNSCPRIERLRQRYFPNVRSPEEFARAWVFMESVGKWSGDGIFAMLRGSSVAPPHRGNGSSVAPDNRVQQPDNSVSLPDDDTCYPPVPVSGFRYIPLVGFHPPAREERDNLQRETHSEIFPGYVAGVALNDIDDDYVVQQTGSFVF